MTDTQGYMDTAVTGSQAVTNSREERSSSKLEWGLAACTGRHNAGSRCPLADHCMRYHHKTTYYELEGPFVWSDYMLIEQGYDPVYCEFYIYKEHNENTSTMS